MKKILVAVMALGMFAVVSCDFKQKNSEGTVKDSTVVATDSVVVPVDSAKVDTVKTVETATTVSEVKK